jgi:DNA-binding Lrp family transcriptional regulator
MLAPLPSSTHLTGRSLYVLPMSTELDSLDVDLLRALRDGPRAGVLELSRVLGVARGTVAARLDRLERTGVITGHGPDVDVGAAGFGVQAFVTLEIAQGALDDVTAELSALPSSGRVRGATTTESTTTLVDRPTRGERASCSSVRCRCSWEVAASRHSTSEDPVVA